MAKRAQKVDKKDEAVMLVWNTIKTSGIYRMTLIQVSQLLGWSREETKSLLDEMVADGFLATFEEFHYGSRRFYYRSLKIS